LQTATARGQVPRDPLDRDPPVPEQHQQCLLHLTGPGGFQALLVLLGDGRVTIERVARYLATSSRSLQRRLADEGTTWTRELDRARSAVVERGSRAQPDATQAALARRAGYSDAGALRRARQRWTGRK
jgi:AraC-like DNA-binding protein